MFCKPRVKLRLERFWAGLARTVARRGNKSLTPELKLPLSLFSSSANVNSSSTQPHTAVRASTTTESVRKSCVCFPGSTKFARLSFGEEMEELVSATKERPENMEAEREETQEAKREE